VQLAIAAVDQCCAARAKTAAQSESANSGGLRRCADNLMPVLSPPSARHSCLVCVESEQITLNARLGELWSNKQQQLPLETTSDLYCQLWYLVGFVWIPC